MIITRTNVEQYANYRGLDLIEEDGIPLGFVWKEPDITIGNREVKGRIIRFKPLGEWDKDITYGEK